MAYQITVTTRTERNGFVSRKTLRVAHNGWTITVPTFEEAWIIKGILEPDPSQPYILSEGQRDRPHYNVVTADSGAYEPHTLAYAIEFMGLSGDYDEFGNYKD
jgi:hypothetical protein